MTFAVKDLWIYTPHMDAILLFFLTFVPFQEIQERAEIEAFLETAEIVAHENVPIGVTSPVKVELSDGQTTLSAVWKSVDIRRPGIIRLADGTIARNFTDSYRYEIAAYELDKLLGTNLVPPTVERQWRGERGALQLWIEGATTEFDRRNENIQPPDIPRWNRQFYNVQLFRCLTYDLDYENARNNLIDPEWRLWAIDSSRAFRTKEELVDESLEHFSRDVLERLAELDFDTLKSHLGEWLSDGRIRALLARRDLIVEHAKKLVEERGEGAVLVP